MERRTKGIVRVATGLIAVLAVQPVLGLRLPVLVIALIVIAGIAFRASRPTLNVPIDRWSILFAGAPFLLMLVDIPRAPTWSEGWQTAERASSLLVLPTVFLLLLPRFSQAQRRTWMDLFSISGLLLIGFVCLTAFVRTGEAWDPSMPLSMRVRSHFAASTGIHAVYGSYYFLVAALFLLDGSGQEGARGRARAIATIPLVLAAAVLASRMPLLAFLVSGGYLFLRTGLRKSRSRWWSFTTILLLVLGAFVWVPTLRERGMDVLTNSGEGLGPGSVRHAVLHCGLEVLEENWLFGVGLGRVQENMDVCYSQFDIPALLDGHHGPHNQFLTWWIGLGAIGALAFALLFLYPMQRSLALQDHIHYSFLLFILLCSLTEDLLSRQWGLVLFSTFHAIFQNTSSLVRGEGPKA
ncbi:MAG: O-antigen ligase family protein [Flavobacteriales bacterium]|nr:O-antigen ligase family protein [Flavobacteriales bacterium]